MLRLLGCAVVGVLVAAVGTGVHRYNPPVGLLLALLMVASAGVLVRAWAGPRGVLVLGAVLLVVIIVLARPGPGGDALVVAQPVGYGWFGSVLVVAAVALLPRGWFSDRPMGDPTGGHVRTVESRAVGAASATSATSAGTAGEGHDGTPG